jgi:hypothetical protein
MKTLLFILGFQLTVRLPEIIIFLFGALVLGFTIHYFWSARKSMRLDHLGTQEGISDNDNWKLKYYNDMDMQEKSLEQIRERLAESKENEQILSIENEELQKELKNLQGRVPQESAAKTSSGDDYLTQLKTAQEQFFQHNQHINRLLEQIQVLKESEKKYQDLHYQNDQLHLRVNDLEKTLSEKDIEIGQIRQKQRLNEEVKDRMDRAYGEFNALQDKIHKLELHLSQPKGRTIEYEELHESYFRLSKDFDELKSRQIALWEENQRVSRILADTEDKLREANFQRQQLSKKTVFLEELNRDLQDLSEHNKKLESQLRRIGEMEALLSRSIGEKKDLQNEPGI